MHWVRSVYVSFDDTDSNEGLCTTFLATEVMKEIGDLDLIGYPRLVRLNPAVPWKTRGNGSLSLRLGHGAGMKIKVGEISGKEFFCYERQLSEEPDAGELLERIIPVVKGNRHFTSDSGIVVSEKKPSYWKGVRRIVEMSDVEEELDRIGALRDGFGNRRGIIGSACGMAWRPRDSTYEMITYRPRSRWGTRRAIEPESIGEMDRSFPSTFNSWEERFHKVSMVPGTPCPVMYGLRGDRPEDLPEASAAIRTEPLERSFIFLTNQGTDDHIIYRPRVLEPMSSYYIEGIVLSRRHLPGGHVVVCLYTGFGTVEYTAYEPSKEFRSAFEWLTAGDRIGVMGEMRTEPRTLNVEKMKVIGTVREFEKISNPLCEKCGRTMESVGKGRGYRCRRCGTSSGEPVKKENTRWMVPGWYEPPASARRHLSKPLKRMGEEQPVEFVNSRS